MSKRIKLTQDTIDEIVLEFKKKIEAIKTADGKVSYSKEFGSVDEKAKLHFNVLAWTKMVMLIKQWDKEIAWHGIARRSDDENSNDYFVDDIIVYPQTVTSVTVETDQQAYEEWMFGLDENTFNNLRFQGHSHVNMGVTPSTTDVAHQNLILDRLPDDMFYIFMIANKSMSSWVKIFDMKKNIMFETKDIEVVLDIEGGNITQFLNESLSLVKDVKPASYSYGYGNGAKVLQVGQTGASGSGVSSPAPDNSKSEKTKKKGKKKASYYGDWCRSAYGYSDYYDDDDDFDK